MKLEQTIKIIYWTPRILCILAILFVSLFALDAFQPNMTIWEQISDFLMHLIPSFILLIFLLFSWKYELIGGIIFSLIGLVLSPFIFNHNYAMNHSVGMSLGIIATITFPFVLVGILFIWSHFLKKKQKVQQ
jgi:hypothetical protein